MPNGKPGDHPRTDLLVHGTHPFPADIEDMILRIHAADPRLLTRIGDQDWFDWEKGRNLEHGRTLLEQLLARHGAD